MDFFWCLVALAFIAVMVSGTNNTNDTCTMILQGSTFINKFQDYYLNFTGLNISDKEIIFDTCSPLTQFDILLNIYNKNKDNVITFCDDACDGNTCIIANIPVASYPIWTLNLNNFNQMEYIFNINGKFNSFGNYYIKVTYPCTFDVDNNIFISPIIQNNITTTLAEMVETPKSEKSINIASANIAFWTIFGCIVFVWIIGCIFVGIKKKDTFEGFMCFCFTIKENESLLKIGKVFFQVLVACVSIISALALSNSLGLDAQSNGTIAVLMGSLTLLLSIFKYSFAQGGNVAQSDDLDSAKILVAVVLYATLVDATFDIIQGIAAIEGKEYSDLSTSVLVFATWLGVSEEIIDGIIAIIALLVDFCDGCSELKSCGWCFKMVYVFIALSGLTECSLGIYLLSTFTGKAFVTIGIIIQSFLLFFGIAIAMGVIHGITGIEL